MKRIKKKVIKFDPSDTIIKEFNTGKNTCKDPGKNTGKDSGKNTGIDTGKNTGKCPGKNTGKDPGKNTGKDSGKNTGKDSGKNTGIDTGKDCNTVEKTSYENTFEEEEYLVVNQKEFIEKIIDEEFDVDILINLAEKQDETSSSILNDHLDKKIELKTIEELKNKIQKKDKKEVEPFDKIIEELFGEDKLKEEDILENEDQLDYEDEKLTSNKEKDYKLKPMTFQMNCQSWQKNLFEINSNLLLDIAEEKLDTSTLVESETHINYIEQTRLF
jgi:hypothetical protein